MLAHFLLRENAIVELNREQVKRAITIITTACSALLPYQ